jgi:pimeloyl-ACP methyl ester carboxylesterase
MLTPLRFAVLTVAGLGLNAAHAALEEAPCRLTTDSLPAVFAQCATLTVPLDPTAAEGPTIALAVARIPALTATPKPEPLVLINGGPGGSGIDLYLQARAAFEPIRRDRDIVLVDQRGTGRSRAGLTCTVPEELELETAGPEFLEASVASCLGELTADPRFFTTSVAVGDLERLREALDVEQWNLYGISYGTRVAQHYLRRYPERVRAVVLDGVVPAELVLGPDTAGNAQAALGRVFARCAEDSACASRFGALATSFADLRERFATDSVTVELADNTGVPAPRTLTAPQFQAVIRLMSYAAPTIALLPLVIDEADKGNYAPLAAQADLLVASVTDSLSFPMHNAVVCTEDRPFFAAADSEAPPDAGYLGSAIVEALVAICSAWPVGVRDADLDAPVESDGPVLLLSGELDPVTPPEYAERAVRGGLANARHLIAPGQGHGVAAVGCMPRLIRDFLALPVPGALAAECLETEVPTPFFVGFHGPAP